jgi:2-methylisocitrate lyase-like PEP mutase family enzyme
MHSQTYAHPSIAEKRRTFRQLHESGCFVIPNPWDAGSARYLQSLGCRALATTSSGFAWSQGRQDGAMSREQVLAHLREMVAATDLPVNADFESGYAADAAGVGASVRLAVETGIAGLSIEDSTGDMTAPLYELPEAVDRIRAARQAIDAVSGDTLLVARAECFLVGRPDIAETIARLEAYAAAGADCLYAPGLRQVEHIRAVVAAVRPKPVNLLVSAPGNLTLPQIEALGVRRVSVGGALARAAWGGFMRAAEQLITQSNFDGLANAAAGRDLDELFRGG